MSFTQAVHRQYTLEITTSALCNLACTYCFEGEKVNKQRLDGKEDLVKQRIYELLDSDWFKENYTILNISFWGGEPTLNGDLIVTVIQEFQNHPMVTFHMYTNGYDRRRIDRIIDAVDPSKLQVQISYDGQSINDKFRLTATGKTSSAQVVENIEYFARKGVNLSLKATVPTTSMKGLYHTWKEFERLHERFSTITPNLQVRYAPTIDYVTEMKVDDVRELVAEFRQEMILIARDEIEFYRKNGYHLMSWFTGGDSKTHCAAGAHMQAIDVDGNTYACHGALYSINKDELKSGSIEDDAFMSNIQAASEKFSHHIRDMSPICVGCVATTCMICPVSSYDKSVSDTFEGKWTDRWVGNMCGFFKAFGEIDRAVQQHLHADLQPQNKGD
jgi:uncharacterized protein